MRIGFVKRKSVATGGGEQYLERLMKACAERGHDIHLITSAWEPDPAQEHYRVHALGRHGRSPRRFAAAVRDAVRRSDYDVVMSLERTVSQAVWRAGEGVHRVWLDRRALMRSRLGAACARCTPRHRALLALESEAARNTPAIIANSRMVQRDIETTYPASSGRVHVVYNGIDDRRCTPTGRLEARRATRREWQVDPDARVCLFAGSGFRRKGLREMLQAMTRLPEVWLRVYGRDATRPWQSLARRLGVAARVHFAGPVPDLVPCYHAADVVALPTWFDPFPNVGLEALRCGTPLVTTRFAGVGELVAPGENGEVIETPADVEGLARAVERTLMRRIRPADVAAGVSGYTMERNVTETLALLEAEAGNAPRRKART